MKTKIFFILILTMNVHAAKVLLLQETKAYTIEISAENFNRIKVLDDRVQQVFVKSNQLIMDLDEINGQVFIKPLPNIKDVITLTVVTEKGCSQDLILSPKKQLPETIILSKHKKNILQKKKNKSRADLLMDAMLNRKPLTGFRLDRKPCSMKGPNGFSMKRLVLYSGSEIDGEIFEIKNETRSPQVLNRKDLWLDNFLALKLEKSRFVAKETALMWIVTRKD